MIKKTISTLILTKGDEVHVFERNIDGARFLGLCDGTNFAFYIKNKKSIKGYKVSRGEKKVFKQTFDRKGVCRRCCKRKKKITPCDLIMDRDVVQSGFFCDECIQTLRDKNGLKIEKKGESYEK